MDRDRAASPAHEQRLYQLQLLSEDESGPERKLDDFSQQIYLGDGLWISNMELSSDCKTKFRYFKQPALIDFGFILKGQLSHKIRGRHKDPAIKARWGMSGIGYSPGCEGIMEVPNGASLKSLHVHVAPERLHQMVCGDMAGMPRGLRSIIEGGAAREYQIRRKMDPVVLATALEAFNRRYYGLPRNLYLEGKAMELISLQLGLLLSQGTEYKNSLRLSRNERERVQAARNLLVSDLSAPPKLTELSHHFCLSQNKLQSGFRELFGGSVFEYLREYKMQKARSLFASAEMNVSQVAWEVGYTNVSKFTQAYKRRFGILPKHHRRAY